MPTAEDWPWERFRRILLYQARMVREDLGPRLQQQCDPSDMVQETLKRAVKGRPGYKGGATDAERLAWLQKILANYVLDWIKKQTKQAGNVLREVPINKILDDSFERLKILARESSSPGSKMEKNDRIARLLAALQLLPEKQRIVVTLHKLKGLSIKATAEELGTPDAHKSVAGLYARGMIRLKDLMGDDV
jgi:RNA polymerase sigma-70 factor (subfamily 1)